MKKLMVGAVLTVLLSLVAASGAFAGELEDQLFKAVEDIDVEAVQSLINRGADVNARDKNGLSVYDYALESFYGACMGGNEAACKDSIYIGDLLKAAGAKGE